MKDEIDEDAQRKLLEQNGWLPLRVLGEGGGARVFEVLSTKVAERMIAPLLGVHDRHTVVAQARAVTQIIVELARETSSVLAAGKVAKNPDWRTRREIKIISDITHPNLIRPIAVDSSDNPRWYVMPMMRRGTLEQNATRYKGALGAVMRGLAQAASALGALHAKEQVHRDVKPRNIFVADNGDWILGDLGVAFVPGADEQTSTRAVSKDWFPRWYGDRYGHRSETDVFMLAATAIFLLSGEKPLDPSWLHPGRIYLPKLFPTADGAHLVQEFLAGLFVDDPNKMTIRDGRELERAAREIAFAVDETTADLRNRLRRAEARGDEPQAIFTFGNVAGNNHSGDHPGLQMVPVWIPTSAPLLIVWLRVRDAPGPPYAVEFWDEKAKVLDTGPIIGDHRFALAVPAGVGGRWYSLRVRSDHGWGTARISALTVHAVGPTPPKALT